MTCRVGGLERGLCWTRLRSVRIGGYGALAAGLLAAGSTGPASALAPPRAEVIGRSVQGRPILLYRLGDPRASRRVLVVGCIHGDECAAFPVIGRLLRMPPPPGVQLWVIPSVNPDGRRLGRRGNAHGVDLNRNFPHGWQRIPRSSRYYSGPRPLSEPEARAARAVVLRARPHLSIWFHQPERNVRDPDGAPAARRYARIVGLPFMPLAAPPGTIAQWTKRKLPSAVTFVVELPAGAMRREEVRRHTGAVRAVSAAVVPTPRP